MSWLPVVTTGAPSAEPVTLAEIKAQCRVTSSGEDALLASYITAARRMVEEYTGTRLVSQTVELKGSSFYDLGHLPVAPVISVTSIKYLDGAGAEQTLSTDVYESVLAGLQPEIRLKINQAWPSIRTATDAVRVVAVVGYATVPESIVHAILLLVASWFANREAYAIGNIVNDLPFAVMPLLENERRYL